MPAFEGAIAATAAAATSRTLGSPGLNNASAAVTGKEISYGGVATQVCAGHWMQYDNAYLASSMSSLQAKVTSSGIIR